MTIRLNSTVAAAAALFFALSTPACKKDSSSDSKGSEENKDDSKKDEGKADEDKPSGESAAGSTDSGDSGDEASAALDDKVLAHFAKDSDVLASINFAELRKSSLWKTLADPIGKAASKDLAEFQEKCGFNPLEKVQHLMAGGVAGDDDKTMFVIRGVKREALKKCGDAIKYTEDGDLASIKDDGKEVWLGWIDDETFLSSQEGKKEFVAARLKAEDGMVAADALGGHLKLVNPDASIWFVATGDQVSKGLAMAGAKDLKALFASISFASGLKVDAGLKLGSEDAAKATTGKVQQALKGMAGQIPPPMKEIGAMLSKLEVKQDGDTTRLAIDLTSEEVDKAASMMMMMMMSDSGGSAPAPAAKPVEK